MKEEPAQADAERIGSSGMATDRHARLCRSAPEKELTNAYAMCSAVHGMAELIRQRRVSTDTRR